MKRIALFAVIGGLGLLFGAGQATFSSAATVSAPCGANLNPIVQASTDGDVILLGACSYPDQNFTFDSTPNQVTVQGQPGSVVGGIDGHGVRNIAFQGFRMGGTFLVPQNGSSGGVLSGNLSFDNVDMHGGGIFLRSVQGASFTNGSSGDTHDASSQTIGTYSGLAPSRNIRIDNWRFHDMDRSANPGGHMECLFIQESDGVTVSNSLFERCSIMDVFVSPIVSSNVPTNVTIGPGNIFRTPSPERGGGAFLINPDPGSVIQNYLFQGNTWDDRMLIENDGNAVVQNVVWCSDNTGTDPALLASSSGFIRKDCGAPPPTTTSTTVPTTTTAPTTTAPTTTAPAPAGCTPDAGYDSCDAEIAALKQQLDAANTDKQQLQAQLDAWVAWEATHP